MKTITFTEKQGNVLRILYTMDTSQFGKNLIHKIIEQGFYKDSQKELLNTMRKTHMDYLKSGLVVTAIQFPKR